MNLPHQQQTLKGERQRIAGYTDRAPINRQAAMIIKRSNDWTKYPPQVSTPVNPLQAPLDAALASLKIERNDKARLTELVGNLRMTLKSAVNSAKSLELTIETLKSQLAESRQEAESNKRLIAMKKALQ